MKMRCVARILSVVIFALISAQSTAQTINHNTYEVYTSENGDLYLQAKDLFVPIAGEILVPLMLPPILDDIYFIKSNGQYYRTSAQDLAGRQWSRGVYGIMVGDFDGDNVQDLFLKSSSYGRPSLFLTDLLSSPSVTAYPTSSDVNPNSASVESISVYTRASGDLIRIVRGNKATAYIDLYGNIEYNLEYRPPGTLSPPDEILANSAVGTLQGSGHVTADGRYRYDIPLELPVGPAGLVPQLSLTYSSGIDNGLLGKNWSIGGMSKITRCGQNTQFDGQTRSVSLSTSDRFCLDGQRLLLSNSGMASYGADTAFYRTAIEQYAHIETHRENGARWFEVRTRDGLIKEYHPIQAQFAAMSDRQPELLWVNTLTKDRWGNEISTHYQTDASGEYFPTAIEWGGGKVDFVYASDRKDQRVAYLAGAKMLRSRVLTKIEVSANYRGQLKHIRDYRLGYEEYDPASGELKLSAVQLCGAKLTSGIECLQPTEFDWSDGDHGWGPTGIAATQDFASATIRQAFSVDWNGDGYRDIASLDDHSISVTFGGRVGLGSVTTVISVTGDRMLKKAMPVDVDADGKDELAFLDISYETQPLKTVFTAQWKLIGQGASIRNVGASFTIDNGFSTPNADLPGFYILGGSGTSADFNGDGLVDLLLPVNDVWTLFENKSTASSWSFENRGAIGVDVEPEISVFVAGRNSQSGLIELFIKDGNSLYRADMPTNLSNITVASSRVQDVPADYAVYPDVNGDGLTDIAYRRYDDRLGLKINTGASFLEVDTGIEVNNVFANYEHRSDIGNYLVKPVDINGDGFDDLVYHGGSSRKTYRVLVSDGETYKPTPELLGIDFEPLVEEGEPLSFSSAPGERDVEDALAARGVYYSQFGNLDSYQCKQTYDGNRFMIEACQMAFHDRQLEKANCPSGPNCAQQQFLYDRQVDDLRPFLNDPDLSPLEALARAGSSGAEYFHFVDVTGTGFVDLIQVNSGGGKRWKRHPSYQTHPVSVASVTNGLGRTTALTYESLTRSNHYTTANNEPSFPLQAYSGPWWVVTDLYTDNGVGSRNHTAFNYQGAVIDRKQGAFIGFLKKTVTDHASDRTEDTTYTQEAGSWWNRGLVSKRSVQFDGQYSTREWLTWSSLETEFGSVFPYVSRKAEGTYELSNSAASDATSLVSVKITRNTAINEDSGVVTGSTTALGRGSVSESSQAVVSKDYEETISRQVANNLDEWLIGYVDLETVTKSVYDSGVLTHSFSSITDPTQKALTLSNDQVVFFKNDPVLQKTEDYSYDGFGNVTMTSISGQGFTTFSVGAPASSYSQGLYPSQIENALGQKKTLIQYDYRFGTIESFDDIDQLRVSNTFDPFGRLVQTSGKDGVIESSVYSACDADCAPIPLQGEVAYKITRTVTHPLTAKQGAPTQTIYYDILGRELLSAEESFDGRNIYVITRYDETGRTVAISEPYIEGDVRYFTTYDQFDIFGRPTLVTLPAAASAASKPTVSTVTSSQAGSYSVVTTREAVVIRENNTPVTRETKTIEQYNTQGLATSRIEGYQSSDAVKSEYKYDAGGHLRWVRINEDETTVLTRTYTQTSWLLTEDDPDAGNTTRTYDALGNVVTKTDNKGQVTFYDYDKLNRLIKRIDRYDTQDQRFITQWFYDQNPECVDGGQIGALCRVEQPGFIEDYYYDSLARLEATVTSIKSGKDVQGSPVFKSFETIDLPDEFGRTSSRSFPNGFTVTYDYTPNGYLQQVTQLGSEPGGPGRVLKTIQAQNVHGTTQVTLGNGLEETCSYDPTTGLVTTIDTIGVQNDAYRWYSNGLLESREQYGTDGILTKQSFGYDQLDRLSSVEQGQQLSSYSYDALGNIIAKPGVNGTYSYGGIPNAGPHAVSEAAGVSYQYDLNGNLKARGTYRIDYTSFNKPTRIESAAGETSFSYGPDRNRYRQEQDGKITYYIGGGLYEETHVSGVVSQKSYVGDFAQHIKTASDERIEYIHRDHLGSVRAITDSSGILMTKLEYTPFGEVIGDLSNTTRGFTDHEHLTESGLIHMNGRVYDPLIGRFLSPDVVVQNPMLSQSYNRYSYTLNNPLNLTDPSGYLWQESAESLGEIAVSLGLNEYQPIPYVDLTPVDNYWINETLSIVGTAQNAAIWVGNSALMVAEGISWTPAYVWSSVTGDSLEKADQAIFAAMAVTPFSAASYRGIQLLRPSRYIPVPTGLEDLVRALPAPRQVEAAWGASEYRRHGGLMYGIEHVMYRHGADSGFSDVSRFSDGTSMRDVSTYVDAALRYGRVTYDGRGGATVEYDISRIIGTDIEGSSTSRIRVHVRDGIIQTAFPF